LPVTVERAQPVEHRGQDVEDAKTLAPALTAPIARPRIAWDSLMGVYCEHVFPWLMARWGNAPEALMRELRTRTLAGAVGDALDIGFGMGFNLAHYPDDVKSVAALEPSAGMIRRAEAYVRAFPVPVRFIRKTAETLTPDDGLFDTAVSTLSLCSVRDPAAALGRIRRVLKRGGRFHFLEHVAAPNPKHRRRQALLNPLNRAVFCGCNLTRDTEQAILDAGFMFDEIERFQVSSPAWPDFMSYMIRGVARSRASSLAA
jgi:SAM-dependent methyltransferase